MIKMLQYKMYPAGELRCPTTALVFFQVVLKIFLCDISDQKKKIKFYLIFSECLTCLVKKSADFLKYFSYFFPEIGFGIF